MEKKKKTIFLGIYLINPLEKQQMQHNRILETCLSFSLDLLLYHDFKHQIVHDKALVCHG